MYLVGVLEGRGRFSGLKIVFGNSSGESKFVPGWPSGLGARVGTGKSYLELCFGALEIELCFRESTKTVIE